MMQRIFRRLLVASVTFTVGLAAAGLWVKTKCATGEQAVRLLGPSACVSSETFTPTGSGGWVDYADASIYMEGYRAPDGSFVLSWRGHACSPSKALKELRERVKDAEQIVEETAVMNEQGEKVGDRVVALWRPDTSGLWAPRASILWTRDGERFGIEGGSLERVLEFERQKAAR